MRTTIEVDNELLAEAMRLSGLPTRKATVEEALRRLIQSTRQLEALEHMRGLGWEGDLDAMRREW
ncbi:MAG: type II toxin-antitoxin system VapB family antitoxin [Acetobacteraceae bacterium]|nr:type II toxin-antitoxin system VapB family antitoxin [Acetobacteraceae bacterium]